MNLYRKYISNKKVIDDYQKQQCTPSPPCHSGGYLSPPCSLSPTSPLLPSTLPFMVSPPFPPSDPAPTSQSSFSYPPLPHCSLSPSSPPLSPSNPSMKKYEKACNVISDILQQHDVKYLKLRSNLFYKACKGVVQDRKAMEANKSFMNLYRKYVRNKKVIDEYHKQQCTRSRPGNVLCVDTYYHKKAKCNKIGIKMNNNTLISWLHNVETNQKTLTDLDYSMVNTVDRSVAKSINDERDNDLWSMDFKLDVSTCENTYLVMEIPFNGMGDYMYRVVVKEQQMKGMIAIERKANQIYVTQDLHRIFHHSKGQKAVKELQKRYGPNKTVILTNKEDCHGRVPYGVRLNRADIPTILNTDQVKDTFERSILQTTQQFTHALMLSDEDIIRGIIDNGLGKRGTFSIDAGFTSMKGKNLDQDDNNRRVPTLTVVWKKWFKNMDSKKLLGELALYVIDHVLPLRFDMDHLLKSNQSRFVKDKHMEFAKELGLPTDSSRTPFLVEGVTIGFANRLKNHFDYWNDYRSNRNWIVGLRHKMDIECFSDEIQRILLILGFKDYIHIMVIFYTRRILGQEKYNQN